MRFWCALWSFTTRKGILTSATFVRGYSLVEQSTDVSSAKFWSLHSMFTYLITCTCLLYICSAHALRFITFLFYHLDVFVVESNVLSSRLFCINHAKKNVARANSFWIDSLRFSRSETHFPENIARKLLKLSRDERKNKWVPSDSSFGGRCLLVNAWHFGRVAKRYCGTGDWRLAGTSWLCWISCPMTRPLRWTRAKTRRRRRRYANRVLTYRTKWCFTQYTYRRTKTRLRVKEVILCDNFIWSPRILLCNFILCYCKNLIESYMSHWVLLSCMQQKMFTFIKICPTLWRW